VSQLDEQSRPCHAVSNTMANKSNRNQKSKQQPNAQTRNTYALVKSAPAAVGTMAKRPAPKVAFTADGNCRISHTEYVSDVYTSSAQTATSFTVNPQDNTTFGWLSAIATRFEMYKFEGLTLHYKPSCATTTQGYIMLGMDFDAYDTAPSKNAMMNWRYASKSAAWQPSAVNCAAALSQVGYKYCETLQIGDRRVSDLGKLWILSDNSDSTRNAGELFITYTVSFKQPALKIPAALYGTYVKNGSGWSTEYSNMKATHVEGDKFIVSTPGRYLVVVDSVWETSNTGSNITASQPADSPNSEFTLTSIGNLANSITRVMQYVLDLSAGAVLIQMSFFGTGTTFAAVLKFSTYVNDH